MHGGGQGDIWWSWNPELAAVGQAGDPWDTGSKQTLSCVWSLPSGIQKRASVPKEGSQK